MVPKREASRLPNSVCVRPSWQPVSATLWWCKWGMWPAACYGFWHPAETSMGLTQAFFFKPAHPVHRWVETQNEIHFFFPASGERVWLWSRGMGNAKIKQKYFTCRLPWTEELTKIKINFQTWSKMREVEQFQTKMLVETRIGRICANCHSVSSVGAQVFEQGGKNCWTSWCQYARLLIRRTIVLL